MILRTNRARLPATTARRREQREFPASLSWSGCLFAGVLFLGMTVPAAQAEANRSAPSERVSGEGVRSSASGDSGSPAPESRNANAAGESLSETFPYTYVGAVGEEGADRKIVLQRNSGLSIVGRGDLLDGEYRIRAIYRDGVEVVFLSRQVTRLVPYSEITPPVGPVEKYVSDNPTTVRAVTNSDMPISVDPPKGVTLDKLMDLRPPIEAMKTFPASAGEDMRALPPSDSEVHP